MKIKYFSNYFIIMSKNNNYKFSILETLKTDSYNIVLIIYSDYDSMIKLLKEQFKIDKSEELTSMYKGAKGECIIFYINNVKYILAQPKESGKLIGIIGKNMTDEDRNNKSVLVYFNDKALSKYICCLLQGLYKYEELKTVTSITINIDFHVEDGNIDELKKYIKKNEILYEIRDLANMPVNKLYSETYEEYIRTNIGSNIKMTVLNKTELETQGLNLVLAVNKSSNHEPKMIILDYNPSNSINTSNPICLVGKGVMYDTGGLNLKHGNMVEMKTDMIGSALVYGLLKALSLYECKKRVVGILLIVQNEIGSNATHPGDVVKSYSGKTVEISDTDAEGRLVLADGISYCINYNPSLIINIGSLTGQVCDIFNNLATAIMTNNDKFKQELINASKIEDEKVWELPLWDEYIKKTKSKIADYSNYSFIKSDTIMCGAFLFNFLPNPTVPWIHLDIGGVSYNEEETPTKYIGATGNMFNTLCRFLLT